MVQLRGLDAITHKATLVCSTSVVHRDPLILAVSKRNPQTPSNLPFTDNYSRTNGSVEGSSFTVRGICYSFFFSFNHSKGRVGRLCLQ